MNNSTGDPQVWAMSHLELAGEGNPYSAIASIHQYSAMPAWKNKTWSSAPGSSGGPGVSTETLGQSPKPNGVTDRDSEVPSGKLDKPLVLVTTPNHKSRDIVNTKSSMRASWRVSNKPVHLPGWRVNGGPRCHLNPTYWCQCSLPFAYLTHKDLASRSTIQGVLMDPRHKLSQGCTKNTHTYPTSECSLHSQQGVDHTI